MTGFSSKTLFYFLAITIFGLFFKGISAEMTQQTVNLPKTIGVWTRTDSARIIDSSNIFDYMNGAGELYLAYGFDHLEVYEYTANQQENILVEVYVMNTSDDALDSYHRIGAVNRSRSNRHPHFNPTPPSHLHTEPSMGWDYCESGQIPFMLG